MTSKLMRRARAVGVSVMALSLTAGARADYGCNVTVQAVLAYYEGSVNVLHSGRGDYTIVCNLNQTYTNGFSVSPTTCAMWYATLLRAKKNNQPIQLWFQGTGSCATMGTYGSAPVPWYLGE